MEEPSPEAPSRNRFRRHRRKTIALVLLLFAALLDTGGAAVNDLVRDARDRRRMERMATRSNKAPEGDEAIYRTGSKVYHHDLVPNTSVEHATWAKRVYPVRTSSLGFRDRAVRDVPLARHPRLLLIGDSFTEGVGVAYEETFAGRLEDELGRDGVSVLNAGVASYCPSIYHRKVRFLLEEKKLEVDTLAVFLDLSDIHDEASPDWYANDFWKDDVPSPAPAPSAGPDPTGGLVAALPAEDPDQAKLTTYEKATRFVHRHSLLARGAVALKLWLIGGAPVERAVGATHSPRSRWTVDRGLYESYGRTGLRRCALAMDQLAELCRAHKIELVLVVYPWPDQLDTHDLDSIHVRFWRAWAERQGATFFDLFPLFLERPEDKVTVYEKYFIPADDHWNAAGHALVADELLKRFRARGPK